MNDKYYSISLEGIDKSGKGQILKYLDILGKHKYVLMDRGLISNITYARIFKRPYDYDITQFKNWLFVVLTCDKEDWSVRCKITNEPEIDYDRDIHEFAKTAMDFEHKGFEVLYINTSHMSPYDAALQILAHIAHLNKLGNLDF